MNTITGFCKFTGKEQTLLFDTDISADTLKTNIKLQSRYECDNKFCTHIECPLYNNLIND